MLNGRLRKLEKQAEPAHDMPLQFGLLDDGLYHLDPYYPDCFSDTDKGYTLAEIEEMGAKMNTLPGLDPLLIMDFRTKKPTPGVPAYLDPVFDEDRKNYRDNLRRRFGRG